MSWLWGGKDNYSVDENKSQYIETLITKLGHGSDPQTGAVIPPLSMSTTFEQPSPGVPLNTFEYSRSGNPTRQLLEDAIAKLEGGIGGLAFASGSAATTSICHLLQPGEHILSVNDVYGGTKRYLSKVLANYGVETTFTCMNSIDSLKSLFRKNTRMVWVESPTNPTLALVDIKALCNLAHSINPNIVVVVDNTFMSPYLQQPLSLGADLVTHSATKYLNGHADVVMGLVVVKTGDEGNQILERLRFLQNAIGAVPSPFDCYQVMRGMRTLHLRMDRHNENAQAVAQFLVNHPRVDQVFYPGLPSHPQHELAKSQQRGFGGIVSFRIKGDKAEDVAKLCKCLKVFTLAESLGGVESLIDVPAIMTHGAVPVEERMELGITDSFVRLSVGIENKDDLVNDLKNALDQLV